MAKLHFRYSAMNAGKTTILLQTAHNYEERGQKVLLIKPSVDTKGGNNVVTRIGLERKVDILIKPDESVIEQVKDQLQSIDCLLIDEAQFLKREQVDELFYITKLYNVPVIAFGLRTDFQTKAFEGSIRLLELADALEEMPTICRCGKKARFNGRKVDGEFTLTGESVVIDGAEANVEYESLCGDCYVKKVLKLSKEEK